MAIAASWQDVVAMTMVAAAGGYMVRWAARAMGGRRAGGCHGCPTCRQRSVAGKRIKSLELS
jgi:hypothetical protein